MDAAAETLLWCLLPDFDLHLAQPRQSPSVRERLRPLVVPEAFRRFADSSVSVRGDALVITRALNEERVLAPIVAGKAQPFQPRPATAHPGPHVARSPAVRTVKDWIDDRLELVGRQDLRLRWHDTAVATQSLLDQYARADLGRFRLVLVARQSHPFVRAVITRAHEQGVAVVFLPHSPLTWWQIDLPFTHVGMRGDAERAHIAAATGADPSRVAIVGNPSTDILTSSPATPAEGAPGVLALSPDTEEQLTHVIHLVRDAGLHNVLVAPHPRSDLRRLRRLVPPRWRVQENARTVDILRAGVPWLIQSSSGVAWESAALGIPTADVRLDGRRPDYPFLDSSPVFVPVASPDEVRAFVEGAPATDRAALQHNAVEWCAVDGRAAVDRARALLARIAPGEQRTLISDQWAVGGMLRAQSRLSS